MAEFSVKALSAYCGVNAHTLRIWERRYGAVCPMRSANGRRIYSQEDAERLCLIAALTSKGFAISAIAKHTLSELEAMVGELNKRSSPTALALRESSPNPHINAMYLDRMVTALEAFRLRELSSQLAAARLHSSVSEFIYQIILPLIIRIGVLVSEGKLWIAHEHALSAIIKTHIYQSIYNLASLREGQTTPPTPSVVIATQEGDYHEFGILLASLLLQSRGVTTHFFGANMPSKSLADAANALGGSIVMVGRTIQMPVLSAAGQPIPQKTFLKELDQMLASKTEIWVGGVLEENALKFRARRKITHLRTLTDLEAKVADLLDVAQQSNRAASE